MTNNTLAGVTGMVLGLAGKRVRRDDYPAHLAKMFFRLWAVFILGLFGLWGNVQAQTLSPLANVAMVAAGTVHTCGVTTAGGVKCWGDNEFGQLGDETTTNHMTPVDVIHLTSGVTAIAAGFKHTCALTTAGGVKCWGHNQVGQLGGDYPINYLTGIVDKLAKVDVVGLTSGVTAIAAEGDRTCALTTAGGVKCWGDNYSGQLGDNTTTNHMTPVDVIGLTNGVNSIAAGLNQTCALTTAGGVKCWGYNGTGQLGDNTTTNRLMPVDVIGLTSGVTAIASGGAHTCAITTAGGVKCWGSNDGGLLGDNTTTNRLMPVNVIGLTSGVTAIAAGDYHTCAITTAGGVKCWGNNYSGQLGDNTTTNLMTPVDVSGLSSAVKVITAGFDYTCAVTTSGGVKCWGYNGTGQLGDLTTMRRRTPVDVLIMSVPSTAPTLVTVVAGDGQASVSFTAPSDNGGTPITSYTVTSSPSGISKSGTSSPITVTGLTNGTSYTFIVTSTNSAGISAASSPSNSVTPKMVQAISFGTAPVLVVGSTATATATASSGLTVSYSSSTPTVCSITGSSVSGLLAGTCTIAANQAGSANYTAAAQVTQNITVGAGAQTITITTASPASAAYNSQFTVAATAPGGVVNYSSGSPTVCTNNAGIFTVVAASGNCVVQYNQSGNANYTAAAQVSNTTTAGKASQSIASLSLTPATLTVGRNSTASANASSGLPVIYSSTTPTVCSVNTNSGVLTGLLAGTCTVTANQAGNANYSAASQVTQNITINALTSFTLNISLTGSGTGTITSSPAGINCGTTCSATFNSTANVTLTALATTGSTFTGWSGACSGTTTCVLNMSSAQAVTANFTTSNLNIPLNLASGWNLLGNSLNQALPIAPTFSDPNIVLTVWKWDTTTMGWKFYTPAMTATDLQTYVASKGYGVLSVINPGEGYWVNAKISSTRGNQSAAPFSLTAANMVSGWNLVATGKDLTPSVLNISLNATPPAPGIVPINITTLWAWDSSLASWYFYAPGLEANGGLGSYITSKNYLDFTQHNKTLGNGIGFWVNKP